MPYKCDECQTLTLSRIFLLYLVLTKTFTTLMSMSAQRRLRNWTVLSSVFLVSLRLVPLPWRASNTLFRRMICSTVSSVGCLSRPLLTRSMRPPGTMSWLGRLSWKCTPVAQWNAHYAQFVGTLSNSNWSRVTRRSISYAQNVRKCLSCPFFPFLPFQSQLHEAIFYIFYMHKMWETLYLNPLLQ